MFKILMDNLIIVIPCLLVVLFLIYKNKIQEFKPVETKEPFIPSKKFIGENRGYVFKNDKKGLGYYIDNTINAINYYKNI
jgi:hypothetical protein